MSMGIQLLTIKGVIIQLKKQRENEYSFRKIGFKQRGGKKVYLSKNLDTGSVGTVGRQVTLGE